MTSNKLSPETKQWLYERPASSAIKVAAAAAANGMSVLYNAKIADEVREWIEELVALEVGKLFE